MGTIQVFGSTSAGIIAIFLIAKIIKFGLDTIIHGIALHEIYGFSFHLIGAIWDSLTQLLLHWGNSTDGRTRGKRDGRKEPGSAPTPTLDSVDDTDPKSGHANALIPTVTNSPITHQFAASVPRISRNPSLQFDRYSFHGSQAHGGFRTTEQPPLYPRVPRSISRDLGTI